MAWFTRFTRFGDAHLVYAQEAENSCGIASIMMVVFKINKFRPGKTALHEEEKIYKAYDKHFKADKPGIRGGKPYDGSVYSYASLLGKTLNDLNCGTWEAKNIGEANVSQAVVDSVGTDIVGAGPIVNAATRGYPIILLTKWDQGGGHFVVVDTVNNFLGTLYASVCDPWDGNVHITKFETGKSFEYEASTPRLSWDLGGERHEYSGSHGGTMRGWVVRRTS